MPITRKDVEHVAYLARLGLTEDELERFTRQLDSILDNMAVLGELDTTHIPPTAQVIPRGNVTREDRFVPSLAPRDVLANAPAADENFFAIPPVFEENPADL